MNIHLLVFYHFVVLRKANIESQNFGLFCLRFSSDIFWDKRFMIALNIQWISISWHFQLKIPFCGYEWEGTHQLRWQTDIKYWNHKLAAFSRNSSAERLIISAHSIQYPRVLATSFSRRRGWSDVGRYVISRVIFSTIFRQQANMNLPKFWVIRKLWLSRETKFSELCQEFAWVRQNLLGKIGAFFFPFPDSWICSNGFSFFHSVVKVSTDLEDKQSVYLLEDGLELWLAALHNSKQLLPQWMQMVANIPRLLGKLVLISLLLFAKCAFPNGYTACISWVVSFCRSVACTNSFLFPDFCRNGRPHAKHGLHRSGLRSPCAPRLPAVLWTRRGFHSGQPVLRPTRRGRPPGSQTGWPSHKGRTAWDTCHI